MYEMRVGVRYSAFHNGIHITTVQGFVGVGTNVESAKRNACEQAANKREILNLCDHGAIAWAMTVSVDKKDFSKAELAIIEEDWRPMSEKRA